MIPALMIALASTAAYVNAQAIGLARFLIAAAPTTKPSKVVSSLVSLKVPSLEWNTLVNASVGLAPHDSDCSTPCKGNAAEICGGNSRLTVYTLDAAFPPATTSTSSSAAPPTTTSSSSTPLTPTPSVPAVPGFTYQGCYVDVLSPSHSLPVSVGAGFTNQQCVAACANINLPLAGTEYKGECYCGNAFPAQKSDHESDCDTPCDADPTQVCGGPGRLTLYKSNIQDTYTLAIPSIPCWSYQGCYSDNTNNRVFPARSGPLSIVDNQGCAEACKNANYTWFGTENFSECFCSNVAPNATKNPDAACVDPCEGDRSQVCGGSALLTVYQYTCGAVSTSSTAVDRTTTIATSTATSSVPDSTSTLPTSTVETSTSTYSIPDSTSTIPTSTVETSTSTYSIPDSTSTIPTSTAQTSTSTYSVPDSTSTIPTSTVETSTSTYSIPQSTSTVQTSTSTYSTSTYSIPQSTSTSTASTVQTSTSTYSIPTSTVTASSVQSSTSSSTKAQSTSTVTASSSSSTSVKSSTTTTPCSTSTTSVKSSTTTSTPCTTSSSIKSSSAAPSTTPSITPTSTLKTSTVTAKTSTTSSSVKPSPTKIQCPSDIYRQKTDNMRAFVYRSSSIAKNFNLRQFISVLSSQAQSPKDYAAFQAILQASGVKTDLTHSQSLAHSITGTNWGDDDNCIKELEHIWLVIRSCGFELWCEIIEDFVKDLFWGFFEYEFEHWNKEFQVFGDITFWGK
ncbi:hypothetical protein HDU76_011514 [Blyttiomyces sp. JEL0837]|nr:hypothetical protein HDU76_011514 [Blyttiomyces sp. JEL0837]